ncbi:MAG: 50S ribosomal protein L29 [Candidatus Paceibacterota bacterium]
MKKLNEKKDTELVKILSEKRKALRLFRFSISGGKAKNTKEGMRLKKDIAQILTERNARGKAALS